MSLTNIVEKILSDAKNNADEKIKTAKGQADEIKNQAKYEGEAAADEIISDYKTKAETLKKSGEAAAISSGKRLILKNKNDLIKSVIDESFNELRALKGEEYYDVLKNICIRYAHPGEGLMILSERDKFKMPKNFEQSINLLLDGDRSIRISEECRDNNGGFILDYKDTEENCTFDSIFLGNKDHIIDEIKKILFTEE